MSAASRSQITLLRPRDPSFGESSRITTDFLHSIMPIERDQWKSRKEFFFSALAFCLSLPCLWRFPKELLIHGSGSFLLLYIMFTLIIGNSLIFFEVALGQYSSKGFSKVFAMCPICEGVSLSMALYCLMVSIFYNFINVVSFTYFYSSFFPVFPYKNCLKGAGPCLQNSTNLTFSPEYVFFFNRVILSDDQEDMANDSAFRVNWRNIGILFFLWTLVCVAVLRGIKTARWFPMVYSPFPFIILLTVLITSLLFEGASNGLKQMFLPTTKGLLSVKTWKHALEQSVVTMSLGMGPLITFGSYSKFQSPAHRDSFFVFLCIMISSVLSGMVLYSGVGIIAKSTGQRVEKKIKEYVAHNLDIDVIVVYSQLFTRMPFGVQHFLAVTFFFLQCFAGWYSLTSYTDVFIVAMYSIGIIKSSKIHKRHTNIAVCAFCLVVGSLMCSNEGFKYLQLFDEYVVGLSLIIIIFCELIGVIYIYGVFDLCDDIEFMLGVYPNIYYQVTWICIPIVLMAYLINEAFQISQKDLSTAELVMYSIVLVCTLCPILLRMVYNIFKSYSSGNISQIFYPREVIIHDANETPMMMYPYVSPAHRNVVSFKQDYSTYDTRI